MRDETIQEVMEEVILPRANNLIRFGTNVFYETYRLLHNCCEALEQILTSKQNLHCGDCEDVYAQTDRETIHSYYRVGFSDAVVFLFGWRDGA